MTISGIGIQQITPLTGTGWQGPDPSPNPRPDTDADQAPPQPDRAPTAPGTGQVVDKMV